VMGEGPVVPWIGKFSPTSGPVGQPVTITGTNFYRHDQSNVWRGGGDQLPGD